MKRLGTSLALLTMMLLTVSPLSATASPGLTFFANRPSFDVICPQTLVEDFEEAAIASNSSGMARPLDEFTSNAFFVPGDIQPGLSVTTVGPDRGGAELFVQAAGNNGNPSKDVGANFFVDALELDFPAGSVAGVGFDLGTHPSADPAVKIDVYGTSGLLGSTTAPGTNAGQFWGVFSDQPITRIVITSLTNQAEAVDNVAFGPCSGGETPANPTLTVLRVGPGTGTVTSNPPGISCPPDCEEQPASGVVSATAVSETVYVLTAHPAAGSVFTGWFGPCSGTGTCMVALSEDTTVAAWFDLTGTPPPSPSPTPTTTPPPPPPAPTTFDLHVSKTGHGRIVSDLEGINCGQGCTATYDEGSIITLTANPRPGWVLLRWRYGCSGSDPVCTLDMSSNRRAKAIFVRA